MYLELRPRATRGGHPILLALAWLLAAGVVHSGGASAQSAEGRTRVVLLGTGTPNADPDRAGPSLAIVVDSVPYLVDAGPGVVRRAAAAAEMGEAALQPRRLATVFLTHLHSDHTVGLPDLFLTPWVLERDAPLRVVGPRGTVRMTDHIREAWTSDIHNRLYGLEPANDRGHLIEATDAVPGVVYEDERVRVTAFSVPHGTWPASEAFGYRFETPDAVIVVSGDTAPSEAIVEMCDGCDVLVHESYARVGWEARDAFWQAYHAANHTSGVELGEIAARARPGVLVLTHHLLWAGATADDLIGEIRLAFDGEIVFGNDLDVIPAGGR